MSNAIRSMAIAAALAGLAPMAAQADVLKTLELKVTSSDTDSDPFTAPSGVTVTGASNYNFGGKLGLAFSGSDPITIDIDVAAYHLNALRLDVFSNVEVSVDVSGATSKLVLKLPATLDPKTGLGVWSTQCPGSKSSTGPNCTPNQLTDGTDPWISQIVIEQNGSDSIFNNLSFTQVGAPDVVPEPASYGLAALALLAAGAATRRRNRA